MVLGFTARTAGRVLRGFLISERVQTPVAPSVNMTTQHFVRPSDCDMFMHMNNAMYFRHAELARWELLPRTGLLQKAISERWMFLVVDQFASYMKPIKPFSSFEVKTRAGSDDSGKYIMFTHEFWYKDSLYCTANVKAIVKRTTGKFAGQTVKPIDMPEFFKRD